MEVSRRQLLLGSGAAILAGSGCAQVASRLPSHPLPEVVRHPHRTTRAERLLNRAGFGPRPGEASLVETQGHAAWLDAQLSADAEEDLRLKAQLMRLDVLRIDGMELRDFPEDVMVRQFNQAILLRAVYSPNQLFERMVDFWSNHFNIYARKGLAAYRKARDEREVIRKHALGDFPSMLRASAKSPAMLAYLDNQFSRHEAPNENYARELLELHTLGIGGGYTQKDVREVARCFTGWGIERRFLRAKGTFRFDPQLHDTGEKVVLGTRIPAGGGVDDGERVLDLLARHPSTADFIASKLCRSFLGESDVPLQTSLATTYLDSDGSIPAMLRLLFLSDAFYEGPPVAKRPIDFLTSALRILNASCDGGAGIQQHLQSMGQSVYEWPMPDGYPDGSQPWAGSLLSRWNFAQSLGSGKVEGTGIDLQDLFRRTGTSSDQAAFQAVFGFSLPAATMGKAANREELASLFLSCPEFQWK